MLESPTFKRVGTGLILVGALVAALGGMMQGCASQGMVATVWWKLVCIYCGIAVAAVFASLIAIGAYLDRRKARTVVEPVLKTAAARLVEGLHARWFSRGRTLDQGHRVSLFMPDGKDPLAWVCVARTVSPPEKAATWPQVDDIQGRTKAGLVNYAVTSGAGLDVPGVPEAKRTDSVEIQRYLDESCLTKELHEKRSWKWATVRVRFARGRASKILCAIVVEREDGLPIELTGRKLELTEKSGNVQRRHELCDWEHQLAADVWAAVRDD